MSNNRIIFEPISIDALFATENPLRPGFAEECKQNISQDLVENKNNLEIDEIKTLAFQEGYQKAINEVMEKENQNLLLIDEMGKVLCEKFNNIMQQKILYEEERATLMLKVAIKAAEKVVKDFISEHNVTIIKNSIEKAMSILLYEPKLVISLNPHMIEIMTPIIKNIQSQSPFRGEIEIMADNNLHQINCNIEWQDGIIENDHATLWANIEKIIDN